MSGEWPGRRRRLLARACALGGGLWALGAPFGAHATIMTGKFENETYFNPGLLLGGALRDGHVVGAIGAEVSVHHFTASGLGLGGFGQWQRMPASHRFCVGAQVTSYGVYGYGAELGVAHETGDTRFTGTTSVHVAPFFSFGVATLSLRVGIPLPLGDSPLPRRGFEGGLNLALKLPIFLNGADRTRDRPDGKTRPARNVDPGARGG